MKLHLPVRLLSAVLAVLSFQGTLRAATDYNGKTYSGNVYQWIGGTDVYMHTNANWAPIEGGAAYPATWEATWRDGFDVNQYNSILIKGDVPNKTITVQFNSPYVGGFIVEADGYALGQGGTRTLNFGKAGDAVGARMDIGGNFTISTTNLALNGTQTWNVVAGKTLTVTSATTSAATVTMGGGGTVTLTGNLVSNGATFIMSDLATTFSAGTLTLNNNTTFGLAAGTGNTTKVSFGNLVMNDRIISVDMSSLMNGGTIASATYALFSVTGTGFVFDANLFSVKDKPLGKRAVFSYGNNIVYLTISDNPPHVWTGTGTLTLSTGAQGWNGEGELLNDDAILLQGTGTTDVNITGAVQPGRIDVSSGIYNIATVGGTGGLTGPGEININGNGVIVNLNSDNAAFAGTVNLTSGTLNLNSNNALSGASVVTMRGGTLGAFASNAVLQEVALNVASSINVGENALLTVSKVSGTGGIVKAGAGRLNLLLASGAAFANNLTINNGAVALNTAAGNASLGTGFVLAGTGSFIKTGANQLTATGTQANFSGDVIVEQGVLQIGNAKGSTANLGTGRITVKNGARLSFFTGKSHNANNLVLEGGSTFHIADSE